MKYSVRLDKGDWLEVKPRNTLVVHLASGPDIHLAVERWETYRNEEDDGYTLTWTPPEVR